MLLERSPSQAVSRAIEVTDLRKVYQTQAGEQVMALPGVTFHIDDGEFVTVVGPSGCGKTTLLKILAGLLEPTSGTVRHLGKSESGKGEDVGVVFQSPVLMPWLKVIDNVLLPARVLGLDITAARRRAVKLLELVGLEAFQAKYPSELSGGMQQRAAIVRSLIHEPNTLLMDEPFGALDALTRERMNVELQRIWMASGKSVFLITHSIPEAVFLSDRVIVMSARPARIVKEFKIPFARPRNMNVLAEPEFGAIASEIRSLLGDGDTHL